MEELTLEEFVRRVGRCLAPEQGDANYLYSPETRWLGYLRVYNEAKPTLLGNYPEFAKHLESIMEQYEYSWNNLDNLRTLYERINHIARKYIMSPYRTPLTPEQLLEAIHSGIPWIGCRVPGKRYTASLVYQLNRLIELEKERQGHD